MTIFRYIIRFVVAVFVTFSFIATLATYLEAWDCGEKIDLVTYISFGVFIVFAYLLWIIK